MLTNPICVKVKYYTHFALGDNIYYRPASSKKLDILLNEQEVTKWVLSSSEKNICFIQIFN